MKLLIAAFLFLAVCSADAETVYFVDGKLSTIRAAQKASDESRILKVQVNYVKVNPASGRFKKIPGTAATIKDIPR